MEDSAGRIAGTFVALRRANPRTPPTTREIREVSRGKLAIFDGNDTGLAPPAGARRLEVDRPSLPVYAPRVLLFWIAVGVAIFAVFSAVVALALGRMIGELSRSPAGVDLAAEYHLID